MRITRSVKQVRAVVAILALVAGSTVTLARAAEDPLDLVDPMIGTMGSGFVFPGPAAPFGMVQLSPDTEGPFAYTGYQYIDRKIRGFSHVHTQSMGVYEGGEVPIMPTVDEVVTDVLEYEQPFSHAQEQAEVGSYRVSFADGITAELTAGVRVGMHRYTFPAGRWGNVIIDAGRNVGNGDLFGTNGENVPGTVPAAVAIADDGTVTGAVNEGGDGRDYKVYFAIRASATPDAVGTYASRGAAAQDGVRTATGPGAGAYLRFAPTGTARTVILSVGISFVDREGAIRNLETELAGAPFGFDAVLAKTRDSWRRELATIKVEGGTPADQIAFETALYHAQHHPNVFQDADGRYRGYDDAIHRIGAPGDAMPAGSDYYANFSLWDTYRTAMPLLSWIQPARYTDMLRSLHAIAEQGGRLPHWGWMNVYADFMIGTPAFPSIADGICRGLLDDEPELREALYQDARRMAFVEHRDPVYLELGYVPADQGGPGQVGEGGSSTLEFATNDLSLALVADWLGHVGDRDALVVRAANWRKQFDPETRFMRPRNRDGSWVGNPYHPELPDGWVEGTGWQYTWLVPQDPGGLFAAMGDEAAVQQRLDTFFSLPALVVAPHVMAEAQQKLTAYGIAYYGNQYAPSNEHDLQAPWLYAYTGSPWKTQAAVRAYQTLYRPTPDGLPGNDDLGTMSAWFVWSAMGLYPVQAGAPVYTIATPSFDRIVVTPAAIGAAGTTIEAPGASLANRFVGGVTVNGVPNAAGSVTQASIQGAVLAITPQAIPALAPRTPRPSISTHPLAAFSC